MKLRENITMAGTYAFAFQRLKGVLPKLQTTGNDGQRRINGCVKARVMGYFYVAAAGRRTSSGVARRYLGNTP
jgi:hypothetical protein